MYYDKLVYKKSESTCQTLLIFMKLFGLSELESFIRTLAPFFPEDEKLSRYKKLVRKISIKSSLKFTLLYIPQLRAFLFRRKRFIRKYY